jgi:hypothetical protein
MMDSMSEEADDERGLRQSFLFAIKSVAFFPFFEPSLLAISISAAICDSLIVRSLVIVESSLFLIAAITSPSATEYIKDQLVTN